MTNAKDVAARVFTRGEETAAGDSRRYTARIFLVRDLVRFGGPFAEEVGGGGGGELLHGERAGGEVEGDLLVNKIVVEADPGGVLPSGGKINAIEPRPINRGETHRTGLATGVEDATAQIEALQGAAGVADRGDLRVGGWIERQRDLIAAAADRLTVHNDDRAERTAAVDAHAGTSERDGFVHPARVLRGFVDGIGHDAFSSLR